MDVGVKTLQSWIKAKRLPARRVSRGREGGSSLWVFYRDIVKAAGEGWTWEVSEADLIAQIEGGKAVQPERAQRA